MDRILISPNQIKSQYNPKKVDMKVKENIYAYV